MSDSHGTESGYKRHWRTHIPACFPCLAAHAAGERRRRAAQKDTHGTSEGVGLHLRTKTPVCDLCLDAACYAELRARRDYYRERLAA